MHIGFLGLGNKGGHVIQNLLKAGPALTAVDLGVFLRVNAGVMIGIVDASSGLGWSLDTYTPFPSALENVPRIDRYGGGFDFDAMLTDLGLTAEGAKHAYRSLIFGTPVQHRYKTFSQNEHRGLAFSTHINLYPKKEASA